MMKIYFMAGLSSFILMGGWYIWDKVHLSVVRENREQKTVITAYELKINNQSSALLECNANNKVKSFEAYFEGGGGIDKNITNNDGSNVFLKRLQ